MPEQTPPGPRFAKKLLVLGGCGFVGGNLARLAAARRNEVVIAGRRRPHRDPDGKTGNVFRLADITNREELLDLFEAEKPDAVVNAAAVSGIDFAEKNRELAWNVNVLGARNVAEACSLTGSKCVFFSSDAVFAGTAGPYREEDEPAPVNYYGKTKVEAEKRVLSLHANSAVIRVSLVLGYPAGYPAGSAKGGLVTGGNALYPLLEERLRKGERVFQPADEIRTPVDVITLAEAALELARNEFRGIIHVGSTGSLSRLELARLAAREMGLPDGLIAPAPEAPEPGRAPRHRNGVISVSLAARVLKTPMLRAEESVRRSVLERL
jgi:dTDP-4-dehydrorhamnose reductase